MTNYSRSRDGFRRVSADLACSGASPTISILRPGLTSGVARAAGGQFEVFPSYLRVIYILNFALIAYQVVIFTRFAYGLAIKPKWIVKAFVIIGALGILANAASRSANERWNVIPALIITFAFYRILKSDTKEQK